MSQNEVVPEEDKSTPGFSATVLIRIGSEWIPAYHSQYNDAWTIVNHCVDEWRPIPPDYSKPEVPNEE